MSDAKCSGRVLEPFVINYASGKIERGKLNDLKHEMLKEQNIKSVKKSKGVPMKRPASAMTKPAAAVEASDAEDGGGGERHEEKQENEEDEAAEDEEDEAAEDEAEVPVTEIKPPPKVEAKQAAKKVRVPKSKVAGKPKQASKKMKKPKVTEETKL